MHKRQRCRAKHSDRSISRATYSARRPTQREWVASLDGYVNAEIRPQVSVTSSAKLQKIGCQQGSGSAQIDPGLPGCSTAPRHIWPKHSRRVERLDVERDTPLAEQKAHKAQLDTEIQAKLAAQAAVESAKGCRTRTTDLGWTKITAGRWSSWIAEVQMGNPWDPMFTCSVASEPDQGLFPVMSRSISAQHITTEVSRSTFRKSPELSWPTARCTRIRAKS